MKKKKKILQQENLPEDLFRPDKLKNISVGNSAGNWLLNQQVTLMMFLLQYLFRYVFDRYSAASINV